MRSPRPGLGLALLTTFMLAAPVPAWQPRAAGPCAVEVERQLTAWGVETPARPQPSATGMRLVHWPTGHLGQWVVEAQDAAGARLVRVTPAQLTTIIWTAACQATTEEHPRPLAAAPRFGDEDLALAAAGPARGVVYVWSPHMPLSVDGYQAIVTAAAARGMRVEVVLDPGADRVFAAAERVRGGLPAAALRVADSVELLFHDVLIHAPSVQVYGRGRLVGSAFPGFHTVSEYGAFLDRVLPPG